LCREPARVGTGVVNAVGEQQHPGVSCRDAVQLSPGGLEWEGDVGEPAGGDPRSAARVRCGSTGSPTWESTAASDQNAMTLGRHDCCRSVPGWRCLSRRGSTIRRSGESAATSLQPGSAAAGASTK
jgi:hypothetical protein